MSETSLCWWYKDRSLLKDTLVPILQLYPLDPFLRLSQVAVWSLQPEMSKVIHLVASVSDVRNTVGRVSHTSMSHGGSA